MGLKYGDVYAGNSKISRFFFFKFEKKMKLFTEREEHKQFLEGLKLHSIFMNQQVVSVKWWMMGFGKRTYSLYD